MKHALRSLALILALIAGLSPVVAQQFSTIGPNTVIGRLGNGTTGPSQAIPFATLQAQMGSVPTTRSILTTAPLAGGGSLAVDRTLSITTNGIDNTLIRQSGPLSLVGRSANSTGNVADISAVAGSSCTFIESASSLICGQLATAGIANNAVDNTKIRQSAALSLVGRSANSTGNVADISAVAASGCVFEEAGSVLACGTVATAGLANNAVTFAKFQQIAALSMFGNCTNATANGAAVTGTANQVLRVNGAGTSCGFGAIDLSQAAAVTGITAAANGGTGNAFFQVSGPTTSTKTYIFPNSSQTIAALDLADQTITGGANVTTLAQATGNITVDCGARPTQSITNGGAFTVTAPASDGYCVLAVTNNGTAGAITFSGFSVGANTGDALTTTNTNKFFIFIYRAGGSSTYSIKALQ